jgi:hypothetical protein
MSTTKLVYNTYIDSISLKINTPATTCNSDILKQITTLLIDNKFATSKDQYQFVLFTKVYKGNKQLMSIKSGTDGGGKYRDTTYYLELSFYGLKSYNRDRDRDSLKLIYLICKYLVLKKIPYDLSELDIAIDIEDISSEELFVIRSHIPFKSKNNPLEPYINFKDNYKKTDTYYIEKQNSDMRSYIYNKTVKEFETQSNVMDKQITRFEIKIGKRFLKLKDKSNLIGFIKKQSKFYKIIYFENIDNCINSKQLYIENNLCNSYKLKQKLSTGIELKYDMDLISKFIYTVILYSVPKQDTLEIFLNQFDDLYNTW